VTSVLIGGCASVALPKSGTEPTADAPPARSTRTDGNSDGPSPVRLSVRVTAPGVDHTWGAWCRQGVWTPLEARESTSFVISETWSRLGDRPPRRIAQERGVVQSGMMARLHPRTDGQVDFVVEVVAGSVSARGPRLTWEGADIRFGTPKQTLYRFEGHSGGGVIARWGKLQVELVGVDTATSNAVRFSCGPGVAGLVEGGVQARAEFVVRTWEGTESTERDLEGVKRAHFGLRGDRRASGFRYDVGWKTFGSGISIDG
jgi:hypothetical protein